MTTEIFRIVLTNWAILLGATALLWVFCMTISDVSIIDRFWGPLCAASGVLTLLQTGVYSPHAVLMTVLACVWALRLAFHISRRNWNSGQDERYDEDTSPALTRSTSPLGNLFFVFFGQATIAWLVAMPLQLGQIHTESLALSTLAWIGAGVWVMGFTIEAVGDWQLRRFKLDPQNRGKILDRGLWAWTRHPNYFGDATVWFGLGIIALETPFGMYGFFGPVMMCYFLVKQTGVALTERVMLAKYPEYSEYMARTSAFIPLPPGRS